MNTDCWGQVVRKCPFADWWSLLCVNKRLHRITSELIKASDSTTMIKLLVSAPTALIPHLLPKYHHILTSMTLSDYEQFCGQDCQRHALITLDLHRHARLTGEGGMYEVLAMLAKSASRNVMVSFESVILNVYMYFGFFLAMTVGQECGVVMGIAVFMGCLLVYAKSKDGLLVNHIHLFKRIYDHFDDL